MVHPDAVVLPLRPGQADMSLELAGHVAPAQAIIVPGEATD
jgi:hypothetical protein